MFYFSAFIHEKKPCTVVHGFLAKEQGVQKQASGRQSRRAVFWEAQHMHLYVSICKPAFGGKWLKGKLPLEQGAGRHPTNVAHL
jgi:hypothetical protein